jgi:hypothetical protein
MSAPERRRYVLKDKQGAQWVGSLVAGLEAGWSVTLAPPGRSLDQNSIFHAIVDDFAKAIPEYAGVPMDAESWKSVLIISHAIATAEQPDRHHNQPPPKLRLVPDLEGSGLVQVREASSRMSKARATSLIDYCISEAVKRGVKLRDHNA